MRKTLWFGAFIVASLYGMNVAAEEHGGDYGDTSGVVSVRGMSSSRPEAPRGATVIRTKTKTTTYSYPTYSNYQSSYPTYSYSSPTTYSYSSPSYTSMYYPTYNPSYNNVNYSTIYNGMNTSNPYGYSYSVPSTNYPSIGYPPVYPSYPTYPSNQYSYPTYSYGYSTPPNSGYNPSFYSASYYPSGASSSLAYYPNAAKSLTVQSYNGGYGSFNPYYGSYAGPLGGFSYNRVPGYGGTASYSSFYGNGGATWRW